MMKNNEFFESAFEHFKLNGGYYPPFSSRCSQERLFLKTKTMVRTGADHQKPTFRPFFHFLCVFDHRRCGSIRATTSIGDHRSCVVCISRRNAPVFCGRLSKCVSLKSFTHADSQNLAKPGSLRRSHRQLGRPCVARASRRQRARAIVAVDRRCAQQGRRRLEAPVRRRARLDARRRRREVFYIDGRSVIVVIIRRHERVVRLVAVLFGTRHASGAEVEARSQPRSSRAAAARRRPLGWSTRSTNDGVIIIVIVAFVVVVFFV